MNSKKKPVLKVIQDTSTQLWHWRFYEEAEPLARCHQGFMTKDEAVRSFKRMVRTVFEAMLEDMIDEKDAPSQGRAGGNEASE